MGYRHGAWDRILNTGLWVEGSMRVGTGGPPSTTRWHAREEACEDMPTLSSSIAP